MFAKLFVLSLVFVVYYLLLAHVLSLPDGGIEPLSETVLF